MANLIPVDYDPFAPQPTAPVPAAPPPGARLVPVDYDPFAVAEKTPDGRATRTAREAEMGGSDVDREVDIAKRMATRRQDGYGLGDVYKSGFTLGLKDEAEAAGAGVANLLTGRGNLSEGYGNEKEAIKRLNAEVYAQNPTMAPVAEIAGGLTSLRSPGMKAFSPGATRTARAVEQAKEGVVTGGISGFGYGEGLGGSLAGAGLGMVVGGGLGGAAGGLLPGGAATVTRPANEVVEASQRIGADIPIATASDSRAVQWGGALAGNIPFAGLPLKKAAENTLTKLGGKADEVADNLGGLTEEQAGQRAAAGINDWIEGRSARQVTKAYDAVDAVVDPTITNKLTNTEAKVADILARRQNARVAGDSKAVNEVIEAVQAPGLNYEGIKDLRSYFSRLMSNPPKGMDGGELKTIYAGLSQDLGETAAAAGGAKAERLWNRANTLNRLTEKRREDLAELVGGRKDLAPRQVYERLTAAASAGGRQNSSLLSKARRVLGEEDWDGVASAVVGRLGRDAEDNFSPDRFTTAWGKMSNEGKALLFTGNGPHRKALDDIATVSSRFKQLNKYANPSGTGQLVVGAGMGAAAYNDPLNTAGQVLGAGSIALLLSRPAAAQGLARWASAQQAAARGGRTAVENAVRATQEFSTLAAEELGVAPEDVARRFQGLIRQ